MSSSKGWLLGARVKATIRIAGGAFEGTVVSAFVNLSGQMCYVVENDKGILKVLREDELSDA